jgi:hypothetical protein
MAAAVRVDGITYPCRKEGDYHRDWQPKQQRRHPRALSEGCSAHTKCDRFSASWHRTLTL